MTDLGLGITREHLAIAIDAQGVRHAIYPTASRTLCNLGDNMLGDVVDGEHEAPPDCLGCVVTAAAWDRIDRSAPPAWFRAAVAA